jgi:hypothetical protein
MTSYIPPALTSTTARHTSDFTDLNHQIQVIPDDDNGGGTKKMSTFQQPN